MFSDEEAAAPPQVVSVSTRYSVSSQVGGPTPSLSQSSPASGLRDRVQDRFQDRQESIATDGQEDRGEKVEERKQEGRLRGEGRRRCGSGRPCPRRLVLRKVRILGSRLLTIGQS